jgi:acyl-CoA thioester hydrolase
MIEHRYLHRVRYRECDPMRVVYHTHFVDHFEAARTEALRAHGLAYRELEEAGIIMPVVELNVRFLRPAYYDDLIEVHVRFPHPPSVRVTTEYTVRRLEPRPEESPLATGVVVLCFIDAARQRPIAAPERVHEVFAGHY